MSITISTLVENTATFGFLGEWGLSLWVRMEGFQFLFDTGMGKTIIHNAERMGVVFGEMDAVVLSHGHVDHTGGLGRVLSRSGPKPIFAHPEIFEPKLSLKPDRSVRDISMPFTGESIEALGARFSYLSAPVDLTSRIVLSGEVPLVTDFERVDEGLCRYVGTDGARTADPMADDLSVAIRTPKGLVVLLGCAHRGLVNILRHFQRATGEDRVHAVIGGLHLGRASNERIDKTIDYLDTTGVQIVACSHCTGFSAMARLADAFPGRFVQNSAGSTLSVG